MRRSWVVVAALLPLWALAAPFQAGAYRVDWRTEPATVTVGKAKIVLSIRDASGKPLTGAKVRVIALMPGMPMGEREQTAVANSAAGEYTAPAVFAMEGGYELQVSVDGPAGPGQGKVSLSTGDQTRMEPAPVPGATVPVAPSAESKLPWRMILGVLTLVAVSILAAVRSRKLSPESQGKVRSAIVPLALVAACVYGAYWAVNNLRRPGSMTPLEAQVMQMDAPPPEGVTPVTLTKIQRGMVQGSVRYSGQAAGFSEQDIYPRVTGTLIFMPFYAGDKIHNGQILARLDRSQLGPLTDQQRAMMSASQIGVSTSQADYRAAQAQVVEASSEEGQYSAAIQEADANLTAARENLEAQKAMANSADAEIRDTQAQLESAQAEADFAKIEWDRNRQLLDAGAISRSEYQRKEAEAKKTLAGVTAMQSTVRSMEAKAIAAKAQARSADAAVSAARHKLEQARNEMRVHMAHVTTAKASADSAKTKVDQAFANTRQAASGLAAAAANEGYTTILSPIDGVVTQRLIAPGTLIQPGQSILKIAQVSPIRVQANVASSDLASIQAGAQVDVFLNGKKAATAKVSSVSPMVDATSRTGIVEALLPNKDGMFSPGQFVTLHIHVSGSGEMLYAPVEAVQSGPSETRFVWVATPTGEENRYTVKRILVKVGTTDGSRVAIDGDIKDGDWIVSWGFGNLLDGITVIDEKVGASK